MRQLLKRHHFDIPEYKLYDHDSFGQFIKELKKLSGPVAFDLETSGLNPFKEGAYIRSMSFADSVNYCFAIDVKELDQYQLGVLWTWLSKYKPGFIIHNASFDASWCKVHGKPITVHRCSSVMFRNASTEGFIGQNWKLKTAMTDILGWELPNNIKLKEWLTEHGLKESNMALAPWDIIGPYNALDAGATYQLFDLINKLIKENNFNILDDYWTTEIGTMIEVLMIQYINGLHIDPKQLDTSMSELVNEVESYRKMFLRLKPIKPYIKLFNTNYIRQYSEKLPKKFKKDGTISKNYMNAYNKLQALRTKNHFNINSAANLKWLFFEKLGKTPVRYVEKKVNGRKYKTNNPSTDKKALPLLGDIVKPLLQYRTSLGVLQDLEAIERITKNGKIHPFLTVAGTVTGRLTGGLQGEAGEKFNIQNIVNDKRVYNCIVAPPGHKILYYDFPSLEPHILCEFSKDERLRSLYLENKPHDLYLWFGANTSFFGPHLKDYPSDNPTKEKVRELKNKYSSFRKALKIVVLGLGYNMGAKKLMEDVNNLTEFTLTLNQANQIKREYFKFFPGVSSFIKKLDHIYIDNNEKFVINGRGRPIFTLPEDRSKICNKFIQSTGHDVTQLLIYNIYQKVKKSALKLLPYDVDKHDSTAWIYEDTPENEKAAIELFKSALEELNNMLPWEVTFKGDIKIGRSLGDFI